MNIEQALIRYLVRLGDNALILAQRLIEIVADGPELEEELANANFSLDYLVNCLLVEQPNGHFGDVIVRSVLFDVFYLLQLEALSGCSDQHLADIAVKAAKEVRYHLRYGSQWLIRLGDGTEESHERVQDSLDELWKFTGELFSGDKIDELVRTGFAGPDLDKLKITWSSDVAAIVEKATLALPPDQWMADGGRVGRHSEDFGYLIGEMQHLQRAHPALDW